MLAGVDADAEDKPLGVDEQMAFAPLHLLAAVVAAQAADASRLNRLRVDNAGAGLRIASQAYAQPLAQQGMNVAPRPIQPPFAKVVKDRLPGWELPWQQAPGAATAYHVEDGITDVCMKG